MTPVLRRFRPTEMAALSKMSRPCMTPSEKDMVRHMYHNLKKKPSEIAESFQRDKSTIARILFIPRKMKKAGRPKALTPAQVRKFGPDQHAQGAPQQAPVRQVRPRPARTGHAFECPGLRKAPMDNSCPNHVQSQWTIGNRSGSNCPLGPKQSWEPSWPVSTISLAPMDNCSRFYFQLSIGIGHGLDMNCPLALSAGPDTRRRIPPVLVWPELTGAC